MPGSQLHVHLVRDSFDTPWGFRMQGGKDFKQPLVIQRVFSNSPAEGQLQRGDEILAIGGEATSKLSHKQAQDYIKKSGGQVNLVIHRPLPGCVQVSPLSPPIVTQRPRAPSLKETTSYNSPSPRRPQNFQNTPPSHNYNHYNSYPHQSNSMSQRQHNVPIHVHIEPSRPTHHTSQTTMYLQSPSTNQRQPQFSYNQDPYGTMPRRQRGYSQPPYQSPTTPTIPPPPWATQQSAPKKVSKLSKIGGGGANFGTSFRGSTLPRYASQPSVAQYHSRRPMQDQDEVDIPDLFEEKRPTGPPPKVCNLSNLGGGGINFATGVHESQTLPRRNISRRSSQPPSMPSRSPYGAQQQPKYGGGPQYGTDYGRSGIAPESQNGVMLNRVQSSLDNITLSPRTPEAHHGAPFFQQQQQYQQPSPQPTKFYTPTSLLLENQKMEEENQRQQQNLQRQQQQQQQQQLHQHPRQPQYHPPPPQQVQMYQPQQQDEVDEGEEPIVPVWERRKQFQEKPKTKPKPGVRTPKSNPVPKVSRPAPGSSQYTNVGLSYRPQNQPSVATWQPVSPSQRPVQPPAAPKPQVIHYSTAPASGPGINQGPVKSAPPPWKRPQDSEDETDSTPAWRNTLRSTGVKPWDVDLDYQNQQQEPQRSVPFNPTPYQTMHSLNIPEGDNKDGGPKVVHLQYNSPIGLYSNENVAETYKGQTKGLQGQQESPMPQDNQQGGQGLPGGRDWSQSQVLQFIQRDSKKKGGKSGPAPAPKPHHAVQPQQPQRQHQPQPQQPRQQQHQQQPHYDDVGISDF